MTIRTGLVITGDASGAVEATAAVDRGLETVEASAKDTATAAASTTAAVEALAVANDRAAREIVETAAALNTAGAASAQFDRANREAASSAAALAGAQQQAGTATKELANANGALSAAQQQANAAVAGTGAALSAASGSAAKYGTQIGAVGAALAQGQAGNKQFSDDVARLKAAIDPAWAALQRYKDEVGLLRQALAEGAITHKQFVAEMRGAVAAYKQGGDVVVASAGAQKAGMQQLGMQLGDMATMFSLGAPPMQIFASQGAQVVGAVQLMTGGTSKLAAFLGGPWGAAILVGTAVLVPFIGKLFETASAADTARGALDSLLERQRASAKQGTELVQAQIGLNKLVEEKMRLELRRDTGSRGINLGEQQRLRKIDLEIVESKAAITIALNAEAAAQNRSTAATTAATPVARAHTAAVSASAKVLDEATEAAKRYAESLADQSAKFGKSALEIHRLEVAAGAAKAPVGALRDAIVANGAALEGQMIQKAKQDFDDMIRSIEGETASLGLNADAMGRNAEKRTIASLALEKTGLMAKWAKDGITELDAAWSQYSLAQLAKANKTDELEAQKKAADDLKDAMGELADLSRDIRFGDMFDGFGDGLDGILDGMERIAAAEKAYQKAQLTAGGDRDKLAKADQAYSSAKLANTVNMLGATKRLFSEQSAGYKAVEAAEKAAAALALVNTAKNVAGGAAKIFNAIPAPWAFPVVAAMIGVMASLGFSGGGGSASVAPPTAEEMQAKIGTGTVLGDASAQSESLANALGILADNSNADLEYSNEMVRQLQDISDGINKLTGQIGQQLTLGGGMFDTSSFNLGQTGSSGLLGLIGGSSTTRTLYDQGIQVAGSTVADVIAQGINAQVYNVIEQVKKSSGFLGIGGGTKTTYQTITGQVQPAIEEQMRLIVGNVSQSVVAITKEIGIDVAQAVGGVALPEVKLSFKDMSGSQIEEALQAYFSSVADQIASVASQGDFVLADFQKAGEGLYETLARVARTMSTVDTSLTSIGMGPVAGSGASVGQTAGAASSLTDMFGGLDPFQQAVAAFSKAYLTEAERMTPIIAAVRGEMDRLGQSGVTTNDQFKSLVLGLDLSTAGGQEMFASLMSVAPAFAKVTEYLGSLDAALDETGKTAQELATINQRMGQRAITILELQGRAAEAKALRDKAELDAGDELEKAQITLLQQLRAEADIKAEAARLEQEYLQLTGNTAALRAAELASVSEANRALKERNVALADEKAQLDKLNAIAVQRRDIAIQLAEAEGRVADAQQMRRDDILKGMDPSLWDDMRNLWKVQDDSAQRAATAMNNLNSSLDGLANFVPFGGDLGLRDPGIQLPDMDEFERLKKEFFDLGGQSAAVTAQQAIAKMDARLAPIQAGIEAANLLREAEEKVATARTAVAEAAEREASALRDTASQWDQRSTSLRAASAAIFSGAANDPRSLQTAQTEMFTAAALARQQDADAMERLPDLVKDYLERAEASAGNVFELRRAQALSATSLDQAAAASDIGGNTARAQLATLQKMLAEQEGATEQLMSVTDAVEALQAAMAEADRLRANKEEKFQASINAIEKVLYDMRRKAEEEAKATQDANDPVNGKGTANFPLFMKIVP